MPAPSHFSIRSETAGDRDSVWRVNCAAFEQDAEAKLVQALQAGGHARLSLVAEQEPVVVGHILFSELPVITSEKTIFALALAPMSVLPDCQRQGIGSALVQRGLEICRLQEFPFVVVVGHPSFYHRFGFSRELARQLDSPFAGEACMVAELLPGATDDFRGRVQYPPPFHCWT